MSKYELVKDDFIKLGKVKLYRIKALKDFGDVKVGDLGGYIESENNLSHDGNCWVSDKARVYGDTWVSDNARVYREARVCGNAWVYGNARVYGDVKVFGEAEVSDNARVFDNAWISDKAKVFGEARVCDKARVYGEAGVYGKAWVFGKAWVYGEARVSGEAKVFGNARVYGKAKVFGNAWVTKEYTSLIQIQGSENFVTIQDKWIQIGCKLQTKKQWLKSFKKLGKEYGYTPEQIKEYESYINLADDWSF